MQKMNETYYEELSQQDYAEQLSLAFERDSRRYSGFISEDEEEVQ